MKALCDISALRYHRIPPHIHELLDERLDVALGPRQKSLRPAAELLGLPGKPLHVLQTNRAACAKTSNQCTHLISHELPFGSIQEFGSYVAVTSPALTLFTLACRLNLIDLIMLAHEFCGTFSVYVPTSDESTYLQECIDRKVLAPLDGWKPVLDQAGKLTNLWKRPPLVTSEELRAFANHMRGAKGCRAFAEALRYVNEGAASPFEVQTGMRISLPRCMGGEGVDGLTFNYPVRLSRGAQRISEQGMAYIDVLVRNADGTRQAGIECQSALVHDNTQRGIADGNRITALQSMGYTVLQLSYDNLVNQGSFASFMAYLQRVLEVQSAPKTKRMKQRESELCARLFVDWNTIGV